MQNLPVIELILVISCATAILTWAAVKLQVKYAPMLGIWDHPNERSSHAKITPRGGGIGIVLIFFGGFLIFLSIHNSILHTEGLGMFLVVSIIVAVVSLWDDFRSLGAAFRLAVHVICAACIVFHCYVNLEPRGFNTHPAYFWVFATIWIVGMTNVYNFMDGIDGIAALQGVIAGGGWCFVAWQCGMLTISAFGGILAGACCGFLILNWSPAKIFMGDVGSAFLGLAFGSLPVVAYGQAVPACRPPMCSRIPVFAVVLLWPFIADGSFTFIRRLLNREAVWKPHKSHWYQRMVQSGWSHQSVACYYGCWAGVCGLIGGIHVARGGIMLSTIVTISFVIVTWTATVKLERRRRDKGSHV